VVVVGFYALYAGLWLTTHERPDRHSPIRLLCPLRRAMANDGQCPRGRWHLDRRRFYALYVGLWLTTTGGAATSWLCLSRFYALYAGLWLTTRYKKNS